MWQAQTDHKSWPHWLHGATAILLSVLIIMQVRDAGAALTRNIGALHLIDELTPDHLDLAENRLNQSLALLESTATRRLLGRVRQAKGDIAGAMQEWRTTGITAFAVDVALNELARASAVESPIWEQEILAIISAPVEWQRLGAAYEKIGEYAKSVNAYQQSIMLSTAHDDLMSRSEIHYSIAQIYEQQLVSLPQAIEAYSRATEIDDFQNEWHRVLSHQALAILLIKKDSERAVFEAQRTVELMPEYAMGHSILGLTLYAAWGDLKQAEREVRTAIELDPRNVWPWMHLGQLYFQAKEYESAVEAYLVAASLDPHLKEANDMAVFIRKTYLAE